MSWPDLQTAYARLFLASLARCGVRHLVLSPGARSMPLALAAGAEPGLQVHPVLDERDAAFFALGLVRATGIPAAILCTSGTALGHWLPAVLEAHEARLPLVLLSADRPWELQQAGASQTLTQLPMFQPYVRAVLEVGEADALTPAFGAVARVAAQAVALAQSPEPGPVHVNLRFRKPLEPRDSAEAPAWGPAWRRAMAMAPTRHFAAGTVGCEAPVAWLAQQARACRRVLVVAGPSVGPAVDGLSEALTRLQAATGWPVLVEGPSGARWTGAGADAFLGGFEGFLRDASRRPPRPELVVQLGMTPVTQALAAWTGTAVTRVRVHVAPHGWYDPQGRADAVVHAQPVEFANALAELLEPTDVRARCDAAWSAELWRLESSVREAARMGTTAVWHDGTVARALVESLPAGALLCVGNSMAVRDLDTWSPPANHGVTVLHQRGVAGIDGLVSGAAGACLGADRPTALLLGDLAAQHDLGGFASLRNLQQPLVIVVTNNQGGRIFAELPVGRIPELAQTVERHLITPQQLDFQHVAAAFDLPFARVTDGPNLAAVLREAWQRPGAMLVEAVVAADAGGEARRAMGVAVAGQAALGGAGRPKATHHSNGGLSHGKPAFAGSEAGSEVSDAPTLVLLHGFLGLPSAWHGVLDALNWPGRLMIPTLPGHGGVHPDSHESFAQAIDRLAATLPESPVVLVGYSLGARVALGLLARHSQRVRSAVLVGVNPGFGPLQTTEREARTRHELAQATAIQRDGLADFVADWQRLPLFASQARLPTAVLDAQRRIRLGHDDEGIARSLETLGLGAMPDFAPSLAVAGPPVWLLTGALDEKFTRIAAELNALNPDRLHHRVVPDAGHNLLLEAPAEVAAEVLRAANATVQE
jgi:2-succinyl-5-enolpyruvyl-6-hydroxy-3-cyclohexene-1-carboxylate synthase